MSICPKNKSSKARRDKRRANWKMSAPNLVKCSKCGELMMPHREVQAPKGHHIWRVKIIGGATDVRNYCNRW